MSRLNIYVADDLRLHLAAELPDANLSQIATRAFEAALAVEAAKPKRDIISLAQAARPARRRV